jgi:hypothetical protein
MPYFANHADCQTPVKIFHSTRKAALCLNTFVFTSLVFLSFIPIGKYRDTTLLVADKDSANAALPHYSINLEDALSEIKNVLLRNKHDSCSLDLLTLEEICFNEGLICFAYPESNKPVSRRYLIISIVLFICLE